ncbi:MULTISPECIES: hypothetical protein [unclassified Streptomyces]|uniref:hypothetical protein n=1 Tax=unclassified Streptomyces TaxID=2593676 RepID=UPI00380654E6
MFQVILTCNDSPPQVGPDLLLEQLRRADAGWNVLEHARVHVSGAGARAALFLSGDFHAAEAASHALCRTALLGHPAFAGWSVDHCAPLTGH